MKAIRVKRLPMTNTKPMRYKATDDDGNSVIVSADSHTRQLAAVALCRRMNWQGTLVQGELDDTIFVWLPKGHKRKRYEFNGIDVEIIHMAGDDR